jgi:hypothetical protein
LSETPAGEAQTRGDVFQFQVRKLGKDLLRRQPRGEQIEDVRHPNAETSHTWAPTVLLRIDRDALRHWRHATSGDGIRIHLDGVEP